MTGTWTLTIPAPGPWLNVNRRQHGRSAASTVRLWRDAANVHARKEHVPSIRRAHITATLRFGDRRRRDCPNYYPTIKAAIDGLVDALVLRDDADKYVTGLDIRAGEVWPAKPYGPAGALVLTIREVTSV